VNSDPDLVEAPASRAWWRCPAALTGFHAQRTFFGLAIAWPLARWMGARVAGRAGGDASLLDDGGILFAEALRQLAPVVRARVAAACGPVPLLVLLSMASLVLGAALFGLVWWSGRSLARAIFEGPASRDLAVVGVALVALGVAAWSGVLRDLLVAAIVGRRLGFVAALDLAWRALKVRAFGLWLQHAVRSLGAGVAVAAAALAAIRIGMFAQRDALLAQLVLEGALVAATCLRASWLGVVIEALPHGTESTSFVSALQEAEDSSKNPPAAAPR
jgi:hypothetical protein